MPLFWYPYILLYIHMHAWTFPKAHAWTLVLFILSLVISSALAQMTGHLQTCYSDTCLFHKGCLAESDFQLRWFPKCLLHAASALPLWNTFFSWYCHFPLCCSFSCWICVPQSLYGALFCHWFLVVCLCVWVASIHFFSGLKTVNSIIVNQLNIVCGNILSGKGAWLVSFWKRFMIVWFVGSWEEFSELLI
jgi:hypothetical protein